MDSNVERGKAFLAHYASQYYDPVKAREYYLKNRELKGREPALSKESRENQRQAVDYVRNEVKTRKTADLDANKATQDKLRAQAEVLSEKQKADAEAHKARMEKLSKEAEATRAAVMEKVTAQIEKIKEELAIPPNASPKVRAFLERKRATRLGNLQTKVKTELKNLQDDFKAKVESARSEYDSIRDGNNQARKANSDQRRVVSTERRNINESYRKDLESERQNIKDQVR